MKNKYVVRSRISEAKFRQIIKYFSLDLQANQIAELTGLSRNSINNYIKAIRVVIANQTDTNHYYQKLHSDQLLFGITKHDNLIQIDYIPFQLHKTILNHVTGKSTLNISDISSIHCHSILDFTHKKYYNLISKDKVIDTSFFWGYIKMRLMRFRGVSSDSIYLHLKECEFRYNNRDNDLYKLMLQLFRKAPLQL